MIPKIIHYCWFGKSEMPQLAKDCIASWHKYMPDWEYRLWNEDNFDVNSVPYTKEAYEAKKYAFVSDYVRLKVLYEEGGVYFDVDFEVYKSFSSLMKYDAFAGVEGSKYLPVMMGVCASKAKGEWVKEMLDQYQDKHFIINGQMDLTPNVTFLSKVMKQNGYNSNGEEHDYKDLHIFPVDFFCPKQTSGEYFRTDNTFCEHKGLNSWSVGSKSLKAIVLSIFSQKYKAKIIKLKRKFVG